MYVGMSRARAHSCAGPLTSTLQDETARARTQRNISGAALKAHADDRFETRRSGLEANLRETPGERKSGSETPRNSGRRKSGSETLQNSGTEACEPTYIDLKRERPKTPFPKLHFPKLRFRNSVSETPFPKLRFRYRSLRNE